MTGFEPATSCSQSTRATNCATSRLFCFKLLSLSRYHATRASRPLLCRIASPRFSRLALLATWDIASPKTIINCFRLALQLRYIPKIKSICICEFTHKGKWRRLLRELSSQTKKHVVPPQTWRCSPGVLYKSQNINDTPKISISKDNTYKEVCIFTLIQKPRDIVTEKCGFVNTLLYCLLMHIFGVFCIFKTRFAFS